MPRCTAFYLYYSPRIIPARLPLMYYFRAISVLSMSDCKTVPRCGLWYVISMWFPFCQCLMLLLVVGTFLYVIVSAHFPVSGKISPCHGGRAIYYCPYIKAFCVTFRGERGNIHAYKKQEETPGESFSSFTLTARNSAVFLKKLRKKLQIRDMLKLIARWDIMRLQKLLPSFLQKTRETRPVSY